MPGAGRVKRLTGGVVPALLLLAWAAWPGTGNPAAGPEPADGSPALILTQIPVPAGRPSGFRAGFGEAGRIVLVEPGGGVRVMTDGFHSAADPALSFDGRRILFAGKRRERDQWNIFEMMIDGSGLRQITRDLGNCRGPSYQGRLFTIDSPEPWDQVTFASDHAAEIEEAGGARSTSLYSCRLDGSEPRRLTFNPSSDMDPAILPDGRLVFSGWQRASLDRGPLGRISLFAAQIDGADYALFSGDEGRRIKLMPTVTADGLVVFVEGDALEWDGAGSLASISLRRNLHSYRALTRPRDGLFHSPSPLPGSGVLVSRRPADGRGDHGVYRLDPLSGEPVPVFDDPLFHDVQAKLVGPVSPPDGRSSGIDPKKESGTLYCLDVHESDLPGHGTLSDHAGLRLRVLEGLPRTGKPEGPPEAPGLLPRRFLGVVPIEPDGSFNLRVPANIPIQLQLLDEEGLALRSCGWIWVRNGENRGCIGCHEDGERTPDNRFADALWVPSIELAPPPDQRRDVGFHRDVMPILSGKCRTCHHSGGARPAELTYEVLLAGFDPGATPPAVTGRYVHPGRARTSPLIRHLLGSDTSQVWDRGGAEAVPVIPVPAETITPDEIITFIEWIDLGAPRR